jgi:hypothetical protein
MELHEKAMELQWRYTGIFHGHFIENQPSSTPWGLGITP